MHLKIISSPDLEFYSQETGNAFAADFPEFFKLAGQKRQLLELTEAMSAQRLEYLDFAQNIGPVEALEFSKSENLGLHIGGDEYISPVSNSFRRQILYTRNSDLAAELLIPGQPSVGERAFIKKIRLDYYRKISRDPAAKDYFQPIIGYIGYPENIKTRLYNEDITYTAQNPFGLIIYDYNRPWRGKRLGNDDDFYYAGNMSMAYFDRIFPGQELAQVHKTIKTDITNIIKLLHKNNLAGSRDIGNKNHTELHAGNFLLTLQGRTIQVMDAHNWTETKSPLEAFALDKFRWHAIDYFLIRMLETLAG